MQMNQIWLFNLQIETEELFFVAQIEPAVYQGR